MNLIGIALKPGPMVLLASVSFLFAAPDVASALDVGDTVDLLVPDISYFPYPLQTRQFTCRAVTENAYWLVQDTSFIDLPAPDDEFQLLWGDLMTQSELDSITAQFEGSGVDVYAAVTSLFGPMPETVNDDDRLWIAFADMRDYYPNPQGPPTRVRNCVYVWPEDFDGEEATGNDHDLFYVNLGPYKNLQGGLWASIRGSVHTWSVPTGLGQLLRVARNPSEEAWLVRGLGVFAQYLCYGLTSALNGAIGIHGYLDAFATAGGIELISWCSGQRPFDFGENLGGEFLWLKYLEQRTGPGVITGIVQSDETGMLAVARAIDPMVPDSSVLELVVYPLYEDWLITNLVGHIAGEYEGGIYRYAFLNELGYPFTIIDSPASFLAEFESYPFPTWIAPVGYGISAQVFAAQYASFKGDYGSGGYTTVWFDGMYNQNSGSGPNLDGNWVVHRIVLSDDSTLQSVDSLLLDGLFNGTFELEGTSTYLVLANANPGGTAQLRYALSQDTAPKSLFLSALQNAMDRQYLRVYASLVREDDQQPYGFDWVGPDLEFSLLNGSGVPDSTATVGMEPLAGTLWTGMAHAWDAGTYRLACTGWDSLGLPHADTLEIAVGFGGTDDLVLELGDIHLDVPQGSIPYGGMVSLAETNLLGLSVESSIPLSSCGSAMTGILAGPVAVSPVEAILSFPSEDTEGAVFRFDDGEWRELESIIQTGRTLAAIDGGGIYALGTGPGAGSPAVPGTLVLHGSHPNPFRAEALIEFSMPAAGDAELRVFDLSGRLLRTIGSTDLGPGMGSLVWDGCCESGGQAPAGLYLCILEATGEAVSLKILRTE